MKVYNTQRLVINYWSRVPLEFVVKTKYTNSSSNNEDHFIVPPALADVNKHTEIIQLIEGTIQSVSLITVTNSILRGHIFFQVWVCDMNSDIPIHILCSDYLTSAKPIGFPFTGIQDNNYDIENGLLLKEYVPLTGTGNVYNFNRNAFVKIEELNILSKSGVIGATLSDSFSYNDNIGAPPIGYIAPNLFPQYTYVSVSPENIILQRNAIEEITFPTTTINNRYRLYECPIFPNTTVLFATYTLTLAGMGASFGSKNFLTLITKELINIV